MAYQKLFDPAGRDDHAAPTRDPAVHMDGSVYVFNDDMVLTVNVALATQRPLLIFGPPGSGKSTLAPNIARILAWRYYEEVISSQTEASDLLWTFDAVRRLRDAQVQQLRDDAAYITPGVLWWAFDRKSAAAQGGASRGGRDDEAAAGARAVVLLDEIDKADPDLPNNLLVPLGALRFAVGAATVEVSQDQAPLIVITTNDERELSRPFLRRCIVLTLRAPTVDDLIAVATTHFGDDPKQQELYERVAGQLQQLRTEAEQQRLPLPSTAEYLDAIRACLLLGVMPDAADWDAVLRAALAKWIDASRETQ